MKRAIVLWTVLLACVSAYAQELDQADPAAVARAYLEACEKGDLEAAARVSAEDWDLEALHRIVTKPEGTSYIQQLLAEVLCMPLIPNIHHVMGEVASAGEECRVKVASTYSQPTTLVLKKNERGEWGVALWDTLQETGGYRPGGNLPGSILITEMGSSEQEVCQRNLKLLGMAVMMYVEDHNKVLPPAETWCSDLLPYVQGTNLFTCPVNPYGYTYNVTLSRKPLDQIKRPAETVMFFELGRREKDAAADPERVEGAHPHNHGDNLAYVDGHVKFAPGP